MKNVESSRKEISEEFIPIQTNFELDQHEKLIVPVQKSIFYRLANYLHSHNLDTETVKTRFGPAVTFAVKATAVAAGAVLAYNLAKPRPEQKPIRKLTTREEHLFNNFMQNHYSKIMGHLIFLTNPVTNMDNSFTAEEIFNKTIVNILRHSDTYLPLLEKPDEFLKLFYRISTNLSKNAFRDAHRRIGHQFTPGERDNEEVFEKLTGTATPHIESELIRSQERRRVTRAIAMLPPRYQLILWLKSDIQITDPQGNRSEELENKTIAYILDLSEGAVKSLYYRAMQNLAKQLSIE